MRNLVFCALTVVVLSVPVIVGLGNISASATENPSGRVPNSSKQGRIIQANPLNYKTLLATLRAGDTLNLQSGIYRKGLTLPPLHGKPNRPITITGPADRSAQILARKCCNTVNFKSASYIVVQNLTLDGQNIPNVDGVKSVGATHHITIQNLKIINHGATQQTVGISTKAPAWNWVIRNNVIIGAGTGLYLGNSDGKAPFVHGVIEYNRVVNPVGYAMQIKHQKPRPRLAGMPTHKGATIIRYNVFQKDQQPKKGFQGSRPNLLVGHLPTRGPGIEDYYDIYGNFLYQNKSNESLFQGEGNFGFHNNVLVNDYGSGIRIQRHNDRPRRIRVFNNTIIARDTGIYVNDGYPEFKQSVIANAVFSGLGIQSFDHQHNVVDEYEAAGKYLTSYKGGIAKLTLYPQKGKLLGDLIDLQRFSQYADYKKDFNRNSRDGVYRGAYVWAGNNEIKSPALSLLK